MKRYKVYVYNTVDKGSPPRGRGKGGIPDHHPAVPGITPAWAGKSFSQSMWNRASWDHPRVGGEKLLSEWGQGWPLGSPPRGRGKVLLNMLDIQRQRITPAWAGKSCN